MFRWRAVVGFAMAPTLAYWDIRGVSLILFSHQGVMGNKLDDDGPESHIFYAANTKF